MSKISGYSTAVFSWNRFIFPVASHGEVSGSLARAPLRSRRPHSSGGSFGRDICAHGRRFCSRRYPSEGKLRFWAQKVADPFLHHPPIKIPLAKSAHQNTACKVRPSKSHLICVALPHTFSISATRSTPKKLRSSSFSHNVCGRTVIFVWQCHTNDMRF